MTNQILANFNFHEIKEFVIFLESTIPFDNGIFFTFDSEHEILNIIKTELLDFCGVDESEIEEAEYSLMAIMPDSINTIDDSFLSTVNQLLPLWKVGYIGTLTNIMNGNKHAEKWFRSQFREQFEIAGKDAPIMTDEIDNFKIFMLPEWER